MTALPTFVLLLYGCGCEQRYAVLGGDDAVAAAVARCAHWHYPWGRMPVTAQIVQQLADAPALPSWLAEVLGRLPEPPRAEPDKGGDNSPDRP